MTDDDLRLVMQHDDQIIESVFLEKADDMLHHRLVAHGNHRFGNIAGERAQARAKSPGHDNGFHPMII